MTITQATAIESTRLNQDSASDFPSSIIAQQDVPVLQTPTSLGTFAELLNFKETNSESFNAMFGDGRVTNLQDRELLLRLTYIAANSGGSTQKIAVGMVETFLVANHASVETNEDLPKEQAKELLEQVRNQGWNFVDGAFVEASKAE